MYSNEYQAENYQFLSYPEPFDHNRHHQPYFTHHHHAAYDAHHASSLPTHSAHAYDQPSSFFYNSSDSSLAHALDDPSPSPPSAVPDYADIQHAFPSSASNVEQAYGQVETAATITESQNLCMDNNGVSCAEYGGSQLYIADDGTDPPYVSPVLPSPDSILQQQQQFQRCESPMQCEEMGEYGSWHDGDGFMGMDTTSQPMHYEGDPRPFMITPTRSYTLEAAMTLPTSLAPAAASKSIVTPSPASPSPQGQIPSNVNTKTEPPVNEYAPPRGRPRKSTTNIPNGASKPEGNKRNRQRNALTPPPRTFNYPYPKFDEPMSMSMSIPAHSVPPMASLMPPTPPSFGTSSITIADYPPPSPPSSSSTFTSASGTTSTLMTPAPSPPAAAITTPINSPPTPTTLEGLGLKPGQSVFKLSNATKVRRVRSGGSASGSLDDDSGGGSTGDSLSLSYGKSDGCGDGHGECSSGSGNDTPGAGGGTKDGTEGAGEGTGEGDEMVKKKPIMACLFCRERKIACGPPAPGSGNPKCNQCTRRQLECEFPKESRRGQHKRGPRAARVEELAGVSVLDPSSPSDSSSPSGSSSPLTSMPLMNTSTSATVPSSSSSTASTSASTTTASSSSSSSSSSKRRASPSTSSTLADRPSKPKTPRKPEDPIKVAERRARYKLKKMAISAAKGANASSGSGSGQVEEQGLQSSFLPPPAPMHRKEMTIEEEVFGVEGEDDMML